MAAGYSSQAGHLLVRNQPTQGTIASDLASAGIGVRLRSGSLGSDRSLMIPDAEIGGTRDVTDAYLGPAKWSGNYEFYARVDSFLSFLYAALGTKALVTTTGITTHTVTPSDGAALPFLSLEEEIGAGLETYDYIDGVVNTLHLECAADGYLMGTVGMIATKQTAGETPTDITSLVDSLPLIVGTNITVTYNGVTLPATAFKFDLNNNFEDTDYRLGSFYLASLVPKRREVTMTISLRDTDSTLFRQAVYGLSSAVVAGGLTTKQQIVITMSTYEFIAGGTPSTTPQSISFTLPKVILKPFSFAPNGDDILDNDVDMEAVRPSNGTALMTAVGITGRATIA